jgi:hypothetical protein
MGKNKKERESDLDPGINEFLKIFRKLEALHLGPASRHRAAPYDLYVCPVDDSPIEIFIDLKKVHLSGTKNDVKQTVRNFAARLQNFGMSCGFPIDYKYEKDPENKKDDEEEDDAYETNRGFLEPDDKDDYTIVHITVSRPNAEAKLKELLKIDVKDRIGKELYAAFKESENEIAGTRNLEDKRAFFGKILDETIAEFLELSPPQDAEKESAVPDEATGVKKFLLKEFGKNSAQLSDEKNRVQKMLLKKFARIKEMSDSYLDPEGREVFIRTLQPAANAYKKSPCCG